MSCSGRNAHHPSWHMVGQVGVCLSFQQIIARFSKRTPQNDGSNYIQIQWTSSFPPSIYIIQYVRADGEK